MKGLKVRGAKVKIPTSECVRVVQRSGVPRSRYQGQNMQVCQLQYYLFRCFSFCTSHHFKCDSGWMQPNSSIPDDLCLQGTPQVTELFIDSKRDVDQQLKTTCEDFIHHVTELFTGPLQTFLSRVSGCQVLGWLSTMLLPDCLPVLSDQGEWLSCIRPVIHHVATRLFTSPFCPGWVVVSY